MGCSDYQLANKPTTKEKRNDEHYTICHLLDQRA